MNNSYNVNERSLGMTPTSYITYHYATISLTSHVL